MSPGLTIFNWDSPLSVGTRQSFLILDFYNGETIIRNVFCTQQNKLPQVSLVNILLLSELCDIMFMACLYRKH